MRALKLRSSVPGHQKLTMIHGKQSLKLILLQLWRSCQRTQCGPFMVIWHSKQIGKAEKLGKWIPHEPIKHFLEKMFWIGVSLILYNNDEPFLDHIMTSDRKMDYIWQVLMTSSVVGLRRIQSTSQSQTCTIRRSWSQLGGLRLVWSTTNWILVKPLHLRSMLSKSMTCAPEAVAPTAGIGQCSEKAFSRTNLDCKLHDGCMLQSLTFASSTMFTWPLANWLPLQVPWQCFTMKNHFLTHRMRKLLSKNLS